MQELKHVRLPHHPPGLFQPDVILPSQLYEPAGQLVPEKRLMIAILEDAVNCFRKYAGAKTGPNRRLFCEAEEWLMEEQQYWAFSFQSICEVLGFNPEYLRRGLRDWCVNQPRPLAPGAMAAQPSRPISLLP